MAVAGKPHVHQAVGAGRWFPAGERALREIVTGCIQRAGHQPVCGRFIAGIAPHAGYVYSGGVAGYTYAVLQQAAQSETPPETVVLLGFSHSHSFPGAAILDGDAFETPLGTTPLDTELGAALVASSERLYFDARPHHGEHSAENQIPFVQVAAPSARLVAILIGDHEPETLAELTQALDEQSRHRRLVVIASTDLLHDPDYETVKRSDRRTLDLITVLDVHRLGAAWDYRHQPCCGIGPVLVAMQFARAHGVASGSLLAYRNSGDDFPESRGEWVVGYGAVAFCMPR